MRLVDVSQKGALVEADTRLDPGLRLSLKISTQDQEFLVAGEVLDVRASILPDGAVCYRARIVFDKEIALPDAPDLSEEIPTDGTPEEIDQRLRQAQAQVEEVWSALVDLQSLYGSLKQEVEAREAGLAAEAARWRREAEQQRDAARTAELALVAFDEQRRRLIQAHEQERQRWNSRAAGAGGKGA